MRGWLIAAIAVGVAIVALIFVTNNLGSKNEEEPEPDNFPIKVDFVRLLPYENLTDNSMGEFFEVRINYTNGPPPPYYLLLLKEGESWEEVTDPEAWIKVKSHGFEVISRSKNFDYFTEYYTNSTLTPREIRFYCSECDEKWSKPVTIKHGYDMTISKIKNLLVNEGEESYEVLFALGNSQTDELPANGIVEFKLLDGMGVTLYETVFDVYIGDFNSFVDDNILIKRVPMGGKAYYKFYIPVKEIKPSPTGKNNGFAVLNFRLEDGRILSAGLQNIKLPG